MADGFLSRDRLVGPWNDRQRDGVIRVFDGLLFFSLLVAGQWLAIQGRATSSWVSADSESLSRPAATVWPAVGAATILALLRTCQWTGRSKGRIGAIACVVTVSPELASSHSSSLILFLPMTFLAMGAGIVWAETLLASPCRSAIGNSRSATR